MMWAQVARQYGADEEACKMNCHAVTSRFNQTLFDAHVNLLRSQTEAMSAALAGVDSITVTPFDAPFQTPDEFSQRIARNQQLLTRWPTPPAAHIMWRRSPFRWHRRHGSSLWKLTPGAVSSPA